MTTSRAPSVFYAVAAKQSRQDGLIRHLLKTALDDLVDLSEGPRPDSWRVIRHALRLSAEYVATERCADVGPRKLRSNFKCSPSRSKSSPLTTAESRQRVSAATAFREEARSIVQRTHDGRRTWQILELRSRYPRRATLVEVAERLQPPAEQPQPQPIGKSRVQQIERDGFAILADELVDLLPR